MLRTKPDTGTAHTPGPWEFGKERRWLFRDNLKHSGEFSSSTVLKIDNDAFRPSEADAHLIAAAPDMLAALKPAECAVEELCHGQDPDNQCWIVLAEIRSAIAKAEGRQP